MAECEIMMLGDRSLSGAVFSLLTSVLLNDGGGVAFVFRMG